MIFNNITIKDIYDKYKESEENKIVSSKFFIEKIQSMKDFYFSFPEMFKDRFYFDLEKQKIDERVYSELDESISLKFIQVYLEENKKFLLVEWLDKPCALFVLDESNKYYITNEYRFSKICEFINLIDSQYSKDEDIKARWRSNIVSECTNIS